MTNTEMLKKMGEDMEMRKFSHYTYDFYIRKTKEMIKYFNKPMEEVSMEELRTYLNEYLAKERTINKKQIPMRKLKKVVYKVLTKEELSTFFHV